MKELLYLKDVATLRLDPAKCTGCGMCLDVCPRAVLARSNGNTDLDSSGRPSLRPGTPGGSEEPTQAYSDVRRGERHSDNEGIRMKANRYKVAIASLDACIECGACQQNCPAGALSVRAGVGCAHAIINAALGRTSGVCC